MEERQWAGLGYRRIAFLSRGPGEKEEQDQEREGGAEQWLSSVRSLSHVRLIATP